MQPINFEDVLNRMMEKSTRYHRDAYIFLKEALEFTQKKIGKADKQTRHITGPELLDGIREYALERLEANGEAMAVRRLRPRP